MANVSKAHQDTDVAHNFFSNSILSRLPIQVSPHLRASRSRQAGNLQSWQLGVKIREKCNILRFYKEPEPEIRKQKERQRSLLDQQLQAQAILLIREDTSEFEEILKTLI